jgi:hypothetical protein
MAIPVFPTSIILPEQTRTLLSRAFLAAEADPGSGFAVDFDDTTISSALVRWLLLQAVPALEGNIGRARLDRAIVGAPIELAGAVLKITPSFGACTLAGIDLTDATVIGFEAIGGSIGWVRADRLNASGSVLLRGVREDPTYWHAPPPGAADVAAIQNGVLLSGAKIHGNLDLRGARIGAVPGLPQGDKVALLADGLQVTGNVLLSDGFKASGEVRLNGSHIQRNLDCSNARLHNPSGFSFSAAGARIDGTMYVCSRGQRTMISIGGLRPEAAQIGGDLDATGGVFTATAFDVSGWQRIRGGDRDNGDELGAIRAAGLQVGSDLTLEKSRVRGRINLTVARIGGNLVCNEVQLDFPGEEILVADNTTVLGVVNLEKARTNGLLRFVQAEVKQGCYCDGLELDVTGENRGWQITGEAVEQELGSDICGLYAAGARIGGSFIWTRIVRQGAGHSNRKRWLSAPGATFLDVADDRTSWWESLDRIDLTNCSYSSIGTYTQPSNLTDQSGWRLEVLDREYASWNARYRRGQLPWEILRRTLCGERGNIGEGMLGQQILRFVPGPYLQLARVARQLGFESAADDVLLRLEQNRTNYSGRSCLGLLWRWIVSCVLQYGQAPFRPARILVIWMFISGPLFKWVHDATKAGKWPGAMPSVGTTDHVHFDWIFYTLDSLVPFVDFGQKKNFAIDPLFSFGGALLLLNAVLGYAAIGFLAAGLTGLVRTGKDD